MRVAFSEYDRYGRQSGDHLIACEEHGRVYAYLVKARWPEPGKYKATTRGARRERITITVLRDPASQNLPCHWCEPDVELSEMRARDALTEAFEKVAAKLH